MAFFDRALSAAQVKAIHAAGATGMCPLPVDVANDIPVATERLVQGSPALGNLTLTSDGFAIDGLLRLESAVGGYLSAIAVTNREGGVISIRRGSDGPRGFNGPLINRGTLEAFWPVPANVPDGNLINLGNLSLVDNGSLSLIGAGLRFDLVSGSVTGGSAISGSWVDV